MKKLKGTQSHFSFQKLSDVVASYKVQDSKSFFHHDKVLQQSKTNKSNITKIAANTNNSTVLHNSTSVNRLKLSDKKRQSSTKENTFSIQLKNIVQNSDRNGQYTERAKTINTPKSHPSKLNSTRFQSDALRSERNENSKPRIEAKLSQHGNGLNSDRNIDSIDKIKSRKLPRENTFHLKINSVSHTHKHEKNISFTGREKSSMYSDQRVIQQQLCKMMAPKKKAGSLTGRESQKCKPQDMSVINQDISVHLKNLINFCNQSIQNKEKTLHLDTEESKLPPKIEIKSLNLFNDDQEKESQETARFNQEDNEIKKMKEMLALKMSKKKELLNELIFSKAKVDVPKNLPLLSLDLNSDPRFSSKGMQKLIQSKSVSPSNQCQKSILISESLDVGDQFQLLFEQLQEAQVKQNAQNKLVKIAQISIENNLEPNKTIEKKIRSKISFIQGLQIKNNKQIPLSIPFMKAFFSSSLLYLNLANNGIKQNTLQLSLIMLEYIDLSGNQLQNLLMIGNCTSLQEVQASDNIISSVDGLTNLNQLLILELSGNQIKSFETILQLKKNDTIKQINMQNTPVSKYPNYQRFMKQILPNCIKVDGEIVEGTNKSLFSEYPLKQSKQYCHYDDYHKVVAIR